MNYEDSTPTRSDTDALWVKFANYVTGGDDGLTAMAKAIESEGWVKK